MIIDKALTLDDAAAITVTRNSTNVIDLLRAAQDLGTGEELYVAIIVTTTFTAGGAATLQIALVTDDNTSLSSPTTLQDQPAVIPVASLVQGFTLYMRIHPALVFEQYLGIVYTVATGPMLTGALTATIVKDIQRNVAYPNNYVTA